MRHSYIRLGLGIVLLLIGLLSITGRAGAAQPTQSTTCTAPQTVILYPTTGNTAHSDTMYPAGSGAHLWPDLRVRSHAGSPSRALLHFNLPTNLRPSSTLCRASLRIWLMRASGALTEMVAVSKVLQQWSNPVAWPGPAFGAPLDTRAVGGQGWYSWNVASAVNDWKSISPTYRYGFGLSASGPDAERQFASSEFGDTTKRPYLIVTYVP